MAIIVIPNVYFLPEQEGHKAAEVRVAARTVDGIYRELAERFPACGHLLVDDVGNVRGMFNLYRASDDENVRFHPDDEYGETDRLFLIYAVGD